MSRKLDIYETCANGAASLGIAFAVPLAANWLFDMHMGAGKSTGIALAYFVLTMTKTYIFRRAFRKLEIKHQQAASKVSVDLPYRRNL